MKKSILFVLLFAVASVYAAELKVLTIGNSFTWSLQKHFPALVKAQGDKLVIGYANHGGCTIQRHWKYVCEEEAKPEVKRYKHKGKALKLREMLAIEKWDVVTIQQQSLKSSEKGSFYPEVNDLVAYVKKYAPQAEIVLQQTWAYSSDHPALKKLGGQKGMYEKIYDNYKEASEKFGLRVIPTGMAVEFVRDAQPVKFVPLTKEDISKLEPGLKSIKQPGSLITGWRWAKDRKTGEFGYSCDRIHLNNRGQYLQACVWYGALYKKSPLEIKYVGAGITPEDAELMKKCADKALKEYK